MNTLRLLFFAQARELAGCGELLLPLDDRLDAARLWDLLLQQFPGLGAIQAGTRLARNGVYMAELETVGPGDEVALIPPVSGG